MITIYCSKCLLVPFVCIFLLSFPATLNSLRLLSFGDSVDRYITSDYCDAVRGLVDMVVTQTEGWGTHSSLNYEMYHEGRQASLICTAIPITIPISKRANPSASKYVPEEALDSIAYVHFFGSRPHGPYQVSNLTDPLVDTQPRMNVAWTAYVDLYGYPDILLLHFATWEVAYLRKHEASSPEDLLPPHNGNGNGDSFFEKSVSSFEFNMRQRILQGLNLTAGSNNTYGTQITLRTSVADAGPEKGIETTGTGNELIHAFNTVIRRLAKEMKVGLLDTDKDLRSLIDWKPGRAKEIFRDFVHPTKSHCIVAALKALNVMYSKFAMSPSGVIGSVIDRPPQQLQRRARRFLRSRKGKDTYKGSPDSTSIKPNHQGVRLVLPIGSPCNTTADIVQNAFFFNYLTQTIHEGLSVRVLQIMHMGPSDVFEVSLQWLQKARRGPPFESDPLLTCHVIFSTVPSHTFSVYPSSWSLKIASEAEAGARAVGDEKTKSVQWVLKDQMAGQSYYKDGILIRVGMDMAEVLAQFFHETVDSTNPSTSISTGTGTTKSLSVLEKNSCRHYPSESAQLLPLMAFHSHPNILAGAPYAHAHNTNETGGGINGLLVQLEGHNDIYLLENGSRRKVTWDDIAAMGRDRLKEVHTLLKFMQMAIFPEQGRG